MQQANVVHANIDIIFLSNKVPVNNDNPIKSWLLDSVHEKQSSSTERHNI